MIMIRCFTLALMALNFAVAAARAQSLESELREQLNRRSPAAQSARPSERPTTLQRRRYARTPAPSAPAPAAPKEARSATPQPTIGPSSQQQPSGSSEPRPAVDAQKEAQTAPQNNASTQAPKSNEPPTAGADHATGIDAPRYPLAEGLWMDPKSYRTCREASADTENYSANTFAIVDNKQRRSMYEMFCKPRYVTQQSIPSSKVPSYFVREQCEERDENFSIDNSIKVLAGDMIELNGEVYLHCPPEQQSQNAAQQSPAADQPKQRAPTAVQPTAIFDQDRLFADIGDFNATVDWLNSCVSRKEEAARRDFEQGGCFGAIRAACESRLGQSNRACFQREGQIWGHILSKILPATPRWFRNAQAAWVRQRDRRCLVRYQETGSAELHASCLTGFTAIRYMEARKLSTPPSTFDPERTYVAIDLIPVCFTAKDFMLVSLAADRSQRDYDLVFNGYRSRGACGYLPEGSRVRVFDNNAGVDRLLELKTGRVYYGPTSALRPLQ